MSDFYTNRRKKDVAMIVCIVIYFFIVLCILSSCRTTKYVPIDTTKTDSTMVVSDEIDSVRWYHLLYDSLYWAAFHTRDTIVLDSVYVYERADGTKETYKEHKEKIIVIEKDTIYKSSVDESVISSYKAKIDSLTALKQTEVQVPYPVEKELSWWQKMKMSMGGYMFGIVFLGLFALVLYIVIKRRFP